MTDLDLLALLERSCREHVDYWRLVSWGFVPCVLD
jgi:hypothetical protein